MKKAMLKKVVLFVLVSSTSAINALAQSTAVGTNVKSGLNAAWGWIQPVLTFALILTTVIGIVVCYNKKNSDQPGEFKKYVTNFALGIVFLIIALSIVSVLKNQITSSLSTSF